MQFCTTPLKHHSTRRVETRGLNLPLNQTLRGSHIPLPLTLGLEGTKCLNPLDRFKQQLIVVLERLTWIPPCADLVPRYMGPACRFQSQSGVHAAPPGPRAPSWRGGCPIYPGGHWGHRQAGRGAGGVKHEIRQHLQAKSLFDVVPCCKNSMSSLPLSSDCGYQLLCCLVVGCRLVNLEVVFAVVFLVDGYKFGNFSTIE